VTVTRTRAAAAAGDCHESVSPATSSHRSTTAAGSGDAEGNNESGARIVALYGDGWRASESVAKCTVVSAGLPGHRARVAAAAASESVTESGTAAT
jgi:hypothetical protein